MGNEQSRYQSGQSPGVTYHLLYRVSKSGAGGGGQFSPHLTVICPHSQYIAQERVGRSAQGPLCSALDPAPRDSVWPLYPSATPPASLLQDFSAEHSRSTLGHASSKCHGPEDKLNELGTEGSSTA